MVVVSILAICHMGMVDTKIKVIVAVVAGAAVSADSAQALR